MPIGVRFHSVAIPAQIINTRETMDGNGPTNRGGLRAERRKIYGNSCKLGRGRMIGWMLSTVGF